jgi:hypothetical protein
MELPGTPFHGNNSFEQPSSLPKAGGGLRHALSVVCQLRSGVLKRFYEFGSAENITDALKACTPLSRDLFPSELGIAGSKILVVTGLSIFLP